MTTSISGQGAFRHGRQGAKRPKSFVAEVMRAAKKAGHFGRSFEAGTGVGEAVPRSGAAAARRSPFRPARPLGSWRVVRQKRKPSPSASLARHIAYLKRDGVTRDGAEAQSFDATSDAVDERAFAERCADDRHHSGSSPQDAAELENLRAFTRELT